MLYIYHKHPKIQYYDYFLYLLDTTEVTEDFYSRVMTKIPKQSFEDPDYDIIYLTTKPHSSISIFGKNVIKNYGLNFGYPITKNDGLTLEMYEKPIFFNNSGKVIHGLQRFGNIKRLDPRFMLGVCDWYRTGKQRNLYFYHDIGIKKSIMIGSQGDIQSKGKYLEKLHVSSNPVSSDAILYKLPVYIQEYETKQK